MKGETEHSSVNREKTNLSSKSSVNSAEQQNVNGKINPFRKSTKTVKEDFFDIDFEESHGNDTFSCTLVQNSDLDVRDIFKNHKKSNKLKKKNVINAFNVDFEESKEVSSPVTPSSLQSASQNSMETSNQDSTMNFKQPELFKNPKTITNRLFDIDPEESAAILTQNTQYSQVSSTSSQKSVDTPPHGEAKKLSLFQNRKRSAKGDVHVDFEESANSSQVAVNVPNLSSQESNEFYNEDKSVNLKKPELFQTRKTLTNHAFDIDLEESDETLTQNTQSSQASSVSSQKSADTLSQGETKKLSLFQNQKRHLNNAFEVEFEESRVNETSGQSTQSSQASQKSLDALSQCESKVENSQESQSSDSKGKNSEDTSVSFAKPDPFRSSKQRRLNKPFDVDFEESRNVTDALSTSGSTPTKSKVLPFRKSSNAPKEDDFDVNFNETDLEGDVDGLTDESRLTVGRTAASSFTSGTNHMISAEVSTDFNQSSICNDNLDQWMSDQSKDEIDIDQRIEMERSRKTLSPGDNPPPLDLPIEEDYMELQLKEIVDSARNNKVQYKSPIISKEKVTEKPKKLEIKRTVSAKTRLRKPAPYATKRLYNHIIGKIRPKYGIDSVVQAEELVILICDVVSVVVRRKGHQKKQINDLKMEMAKMGVIETTYQFYEFVREFLPYEFRLKVVPCIQPGTNIVYPPKDAKNPFEKIL